MHFGRSLDGLALRLVMASWLILALVAMNVYGSILVSRMTARKPDAAPQTSMEIIDEGRLSYLLLGAGIGREIVMVLANAQEAHLITSTCYSRVPHPAR